MATAIVFGVLLADGDTDWPGRNQLINSLAAHTPVVFLQRSPPDRRLLCWRRPQLHDLGGNQYLLTDAFALRSQRLGRRLARAAALIDGRWFRSALRRVGLDDYLLWLTVNDPTLAYGVPRERLVYDCMDPNFLPAGQARFDWTEAALARRASVVFASARMLHERMRALNPHSHLLPNAAPARAWFATRRDPAAGFGGRVVGYLGTVDWRFDASYVAAAARALPEITFAVVGRVNADQEERVSELRWLPNVVLPGQVSTRDGDRYLAAFDVGIIPFTPSPVNDAINPVKMWMYLAAGLPVVATAVAECVAEPLVATARDVHGFVALVRAALDDDDATARRQRIGHARRNTWDDRAADAFAILKSAGLVR